MKDMIETEECPHCGEMLEIEVPEDYGPGKCGACGRGIIVSPDGQFEQAVKLFIAFAKEAMPALRAMVKSPREFAELKQLERKLGKLALE